MMMFFILSVVFVLLLWGISWLSALLLLFYVITFIYIIYSLKEGHFECLLSDNGHIEVKQPSCFIGSISSRSFYNEWMMFLCIEENEAFVGNETITKKNKRKRWFVLFSDSLEEGEYRLIARLIMNAR
jgi:Ca2+/Na+ antiporter